jgi:type 1 glutamine amidotransferase
MLQYVRRLRCARPGGGASRSATFASALAWAALMLAGSLAAAEQTIPAAYVPPQSVQPIPVPLPPANGRLQALIITGKNSFEHDWRGTTQAIRRMLEDSGRFEVHVTEEFRGATAKTLEPYDVVLLNYLGRWFYNDPVEQRWGSREEAALFDYVRAGHGIVVYHASLIAGAPSWPEFERLAGGTLRTEPTPSRRNPADAFLLHVVDRAHPITAGMREYLWTFMDDMYTNLRWDPAAPVHVLVAGRDDPAAYDARVAGPKYPASAFSPDQLQKMQGMGQEHPLVWTSQYGKGRVLGFTLGHGPEALQFDGVVSLLTRGTEWAASGAVTAPLKDKAKAYLPESK